MAKWYDSINEELQQFIEAQRLFFVATAPLAATGLINLSPKGLDSFKVLSTNRVAYLDLTGSGNETSAHLQENGRITFMFCALADSPLILRLYGRGRVVLPNTQEWEDWRSHFTLLPGTRQIVTADIDRVQTSCGFGVPLYDYRSDRDQLTQWATKKGEAAIREYQRQKNCRSVDGLPTPLAKHLVE
jgi:hypothetical protein